MSYVFGLGEAAPDPLQQLQADYAKLRTVLAASPSNAQGVARFDNLMAARSWSDLQAALEEVVWGRDDDPDPSLPLLRACIADIKALTPAGQAVQMLTSGWAVVLGFAVAVGVAVYVQRHK